MAWICVWGIAAHQTSLVTFSRRYLCNLGTPRKRLEAIVIKTSACHVQLAPQAGSGYTLFFRGQLG